MVKVTTSEFLKHTDITAENSIVMFVDEGKYVDSQYKDAAGNVKKNFNITIAIGEDEKTWTMNKTSQRAIVEAFGDESSTWIGKFAKLKVIQMLVGKELRDVVIAEPYASEGLVGAPKQQAEGWDE